MRICFFGDSFVNGYGDPSYQGWVGRVCERARSRGDDLTAYNCGIRRATSDDVKSVWLAEARARLPAESKGALVFSFGANDRAVENGNSRVPAARQFENARTILSEAKARWPTLFIASPRPTNEAALAVAADQSRTYREICIELGVPMIDGFAASTAFIAWRVEASAGDGAHPGADGYEEFAEIVDASPHWRTFLDQLREKP